jgi:class 3 adenylate cyclase
VNPPDHRFCGACGVGLDVPPDRIPKPGHEVGGAGNVVVRKIVTVVFADLIGSTALHERLDAESVRSLMGRYYGALNAVVEAHGGTVVKLLGDGVMAAFGLPRVAEDDALRAVRAALAMQQAFRALAGEQSGTGLRVAVNTGEVVVDAATDDVVGDPINVAARLQDAARDGDVVIGEATRRLVGALVTPEVDTEGHLVAIIMFDADDRRAASMEMFERYARSDEARRLPAGLFEAIRAVNARDLDRLRAALPDDYLVNDRRRTGAGRLENADRFITSQAAEFELTSELTVEPLYIVAAEAHGLLAMTHSFGTLADGGAFELVFVLLVLFRDQGIVGMEVFEPEHLDIARARFEELRPRASTVVTSDRNQAGGPP